MLIDAAAGLEYLHAHGLNHGNIAARNILLINGYCAKIGDFGLAKVMKEHKQYAQIEKGVAVPFRVFFLIVLFLF